MYKFDRTITLMTIASPLNQNLALLAPNEHISADSLACIHDGYINVIPILDPSRRCKYVSLCSGKERGRGLVRQIRWVRLSGETVFVVASTEGLHVYDADVHDVKYFHSCKVVGGDTNYTNGICALDNRTLCIGSNFGIVWAFQGNDTNTNFDVVDRFHAHDEAVTLLDGIAEYLVSSSDKSTYLWHLRGRQFEISRRISVPGMLSTPTALKVSNYLIFLGYESGELCVFDILDPGLLVRTVAHKLKVTGVDFSVLKHLTLTASEDCYIKLWTFNEFSSEGSCVFSIFNESGPLCGVGFLNHSCTEFCAVTAGDVAVNVYVANTQVENSSDTVSGQKEIQA